MRWYELGKNVALCKFSGYNQEVEWFKFKSRRMWRNFVKLWFHLPEGIAGSPGTHSWTKTQRTHLVHIVEGPRGVDDHRRGVGGNFEPREERRTRILQVRKRDWVAVPVQPPFPFLLIGETLLSFKEPRHSLLLVLVVWVEPTPNSRDSCTNPSVLLWLCD